MSTRTRDREQDETKASSSSPVKRMRMLTSSPTLYLAVQWVIQQMRLYGTQKLDRRGLVDAWSAWPDLHLDDFCARLVRQRILLMNPSEPGWYTVHPLLYKHDIATTN